jgi:hypothetical protein
MANANAALPKSQPQSTMPRRRHHPLEPMFGQALIWLTLYLMWRFVLSPLIMPDYTTLTIAISWLEFDPDGLYLRFERFVCLTKPTQWFPIGYAISCIIIFFFQPPGQYTDRMFASVISWSVEFFFWRLGHLFAIHVLDRFLELLLQLVGLDLPLLCAARPSTLWCVLGVVGFIDRFRFLVVRRWKEQWDTYTSPPPTSEPRARDLDDSTDPGQSDGSRTNKRTLITWQAMRTTVITHSMQQQQQATEHNS